LLVDNLRITTLAGAVDWERLAVWSVDDIAGAARQVFEHPPGGRGEN
jgi:hypothetical protein